jgi:NADPH:quinone reductase-like Zn-dependent oxidoreductase
MRRDPALTIQPVQHLARAEGSVDESPDVLRRVMDLVGKGMLKPHVSHRLPLDQAADAHRMAEQGGDGHGRIVLDIPPL